MLELVETKCRLSLHLKLLLRPDLDSRLSLNLKLFCKEKYFYLRSVAASTTTLLKTPLLFESSSSSTSTTASRSQSTDPSSKPPLKVETSPTATRSLSHDSTVALRSGKVLKEVKHRNPKTLNSQFFLASQAVNV